MYALPMDSRDPTLRSMLGPIKARGLHDIKIQKILQQHCERGRIAEAADVVGLALYHAALEDGRVPQPRGVRTRELVDRAIDGVRHLVETYARSGVLCAKGFYSPSQLMLNIIGLWEADFSSVLRHPEEPSGMLDGVDPDFISRSTVAAERLRSLMLARLQVSPDGEHLLLPMKEMEGFCVATVRNTYFSLLKPDVAVHEVFHKEKVVLENEAIADEAKDAFTMGWLRADVDINYRTRLLFHMHVEEGRGEAFALGWYLRQLMHLFGEKAVSA